ncbi:aminotransferase-like domain-containing protein [Kurthia sibirica]|uniref:Aspartate aminotransferase n=1 Tax=Kurthia sibirica TaxID=202750 RepID=A0A2U3ANG6_9BACL|nr:PLP-dependent aminotransferase family protein [Kurthia sibirica]PWI26039.1 aspartate aminotransferase [Kurthia sibirica]GEK34560.1 aspartate aminotransferase [Kurthia sibirica]
MQYSDRVLKTPSSFIRNILKVTDSPNVISFAGGLPNPVSFPVNQLQEAVERAISSNGAKIFQYASTTGYLPLRQYIADKYNRLNNLGLTADDILLTTGSQQALSLISQVFINKGDGIIMEEPGYLGAIQAFTMSEPTFYPVTLEEDGLNIEELQQALVKPNAKFIYTVPNFQNPTGLTYTMERRQEIYDLIKNEDIFIIEDDPYGELRFEGDHLPYIAAGKTDKSIILGSFSKTVTPGMRVGFVICKNKEFMSHMETAKQAADLHSNIFSQYTIYEYLTHNDYTSHVKKIIDLYQSQANVMLAALEEFFPENVTFTRPQGGMFIWATLNNGMSALEFFHKAMAVDVAFVPGDPFYASKTNVNTLRLNYTNATPEVIREGIQRLAKILYEVEVAETV